MNPRKDFENGEFVSNRVIVLRKAPQPPPLPRINCSIDRRIQHILFPLVKEHQQFGNFRIQNADAESFRIHDAILGESSNKVRLRKGSMVYRRGLQGAVNPTRQTCVYMERGVPVRRVVSSTGSNPCHGVQSPSIYKKNHIFRVPVESLPENHNEKPVRSPQTVCVNIWEEFMFGKNIVNRYTNGQDSPSVTERIRTYLQYLLPTDIIDYLLYTIYFIILFFSCMAYNMFWELGTYMLFASHLQIHSESYEKNIDVDFTGSIFQGPMYVFVRTWCEHCQQKEREKIMFRLMKKMKLDITGHS